MNRKQRACIVCGFFLLLLSFLFPPSRGTGYYSATSYRFLLSTHEGAGTIEFSRLFLEWMLIALVIVGLFYLLRESTLSQPETRMHSVAISEHTGRRPSSLSIVLYVLIAALGITSYGLLRKVRRLEAGIQNLNVILAELPPPGTHLSTLTPQDVLQADSQYHYTSDVWAAWVVIERQNLIASYERIRRMKEELSKLD
jgi:hypothetical protein